MMNTIKLLALSIAILLQVGYLNAQNNCLDYDVTEVYVNCDSTINSSIGNQITISAWVYPEFNA